MDAKFFLDKGGGVMIEGLDVDNHAHIVSQRLPKTTQQNPTIQLS